MKKLILSIALFYSLSNAKAQTKVFVDESGNYATAQSSTISQECKPNGKFFIQKNGLKLPVYETSKGKLFVFVTSKRGNIYRKYLTISN